MRLLVSVRFRLFALVALVVIGLGGLSYGTLTIVDSALRSAAFDRLTAIRQVKAGSIESYFGTIEQQVVAMSENVMTREAMAAFSDAYRNLEPASANVEAARAAMEEYIAEEYVPRIPAQDRPGEEEYSGLLAATPAGVILQDRYIASNENPVGSKEDLVNAGVDEYDAVHGRYHPSFRSYLRRLGFYDIFLVEPENGRIVYSVFKEADFQTSMRDGPYRESGIAEAYRRAMDSSDAGRSFLVDFREYLPSYGAPASFISSPIESEGEIIGVLIFQMPVDRINQVMTNSQSWRDEGLGDTGHSYIVGSDMLMRTEHRRYLETPARFVDTLASAPDYESIRGEVEAYETTILTMPVQMPFLTGDQRTGQQIAQDYSGESVLASYTPVSIGGLDWTLVAQIDEAEALASLRTIQQLLLLITVVLLLVLLVAMLLTSRSITRPLHRTGGLMQQIAQGEGDLTARLQVSRRDEIGVLAEHFNTFVDTLGRIVRRIKTEVSQAEEISETLSASSEESSAAVHQITQNLGSMTRQIKGMDQNIQETSAATEEIQAIIANVVQSIERQRQAVTESSSAIEEMIASVRAVTENTERRQAETGELLQSVQTGDEKIGTTTKLMSDVDTSAGAIGEAVQVISDIAAQTDLLAMNAAIEAAHAGEAGRGFAVVAEEIRKLSESTRENSQLIGENIQSSLQTIRKALEATEETGAAFGRIRTEVEKFTEAFGEINGTMQELASAGSQVLNSISALQSFSDEVQDGSTQMKEGADDITRNILSIRDLSSQVATGIDEVETGTREIRTAGSDLAELGQKNRASLKQIRDEVSGFKTDEGEH